MEVECDLEWHWVEYCCCQNVITGSLESSSSKATGIFLIMRRNVSTELLFSSPFLWRKNLYHPKFQDSKNYSHKVQYTFNGRENWAIWVTESVCPCVCVWWILTCTSNTGVASCKVFIYHWIKEIHHIQWYTLLPRVPSDHTRVYGTKHVIPLCNHSALLKERSGTY